MNSLSFSFFLDTKKCHFWTRQLLAMKMDLLWESKMKIIVARLRTAINISFWMESTGEKKSSSLCLIGFKENVFMTNCWNLDKLLLSKIIQHWFCTMTMSVLIFTLVTFKLSLVLLSKISLIYGSSKLKISKKSLNNSLDQS